MRNDTGGSTREQDGRPIPAAGDRQARRLAAGATVSIPPRTRSAVPYGPTTLRARLVLLRPQPVRLRPPGTDEG